MNSKPRPAVPPSCAIWSDVNGHAWGYIGQDGQMLDEDGRELSTKQRSLMPVLVILVAMLLLAITLLTAAWQGAFDMEPSSSRVTPAPYGYPCEVKQDGTQRR